MIVDIVGFGAAAVLAALSALHVYWTLGGRAGSAGAVPSVGDRPQFVPSKGATVVVAALLAASAALVVGGVSRWDPRVGFRIGCAGIAGVLLARAVGDRRSVGFFKRVQDTEFARRDTWVFSPLCLGLAGAAAAVALRS